jgi:hypothetical protein
MVSKIMQWMSVQCLTGNQRLELAGETLMNDYNILEKEQLITF